MFPHQLKMPAPVLHYTFGEAQYTNTTEDVQYITTLKNMSQYQYRAAHSQTDNLTLYKLTNCQKQIACQSQLKMLASVLRYTFRETQHTYIITDVQYITTLQNTTVREEMLCWADNLCEIIKRCVHELQFIFSVQISFVHFCHVCTMSFVYFV